MVIVFFDCKDKQKIHISPRKSMGKFFLPRISLRSYDEVRCFFIETDIRVILS